MAWRWFKKWWKPRGSSKQDHRAKASLSLLPGDILFMICQYLRTPQVLMLMLSCARFWNSRNTGVFGSRWQELASSPVDLNKVLLRFHVLRMLEYDGLLQRGSLPRYCCWECMKSPKQEDFSPKELRKRVNLKAEQSNRSRLKRPSRRRLCRPCAQNKRYMWFGVCRDVSFAWLRHKVINSDYQQKRANGWIRLPDRHIFWFEDCSSFDAENRWFVYGFALASVRDVSTFVLFEKLAREVQIPLCPHTRVCDPEIINLYNSPHSRKTYSCKYCTTTVEMMFSANVVIYVFRYVGMLCSPTDPTWMAQSYQERDKRLGAHCRRFLDWYTNRYERGRTVEEFRSQEVCKPFEGVVYCTPELPKKGPVDSQKFYTHPHYISE